MSNVHRRHLHARDNGSQARAGPTKFFAFYNTRRPHQDLHYHTLNPAYLAALAPE
jgi:putative transposase